MKPPVLVTREPQFPLPIPVVKLSLVGLMPQQPAMVVVVVLEVVVVVVTIVLVVVVTGAVVVVTGAVVVVAADVVVVVGAAVVVVAAETQGLCAQEPGPMFVAPGCLAQLSGVNCPHSSVPPSGMQQITLNGGPFPWPAAT